MPFGYPRLEQGRDNMIIEGDMSDLYNLAPSTVVIYSTEWCSDCRRVKAFFEANQIPHLQVQIEGDAEASQFVAALNRGYHSVPTIIFPDGSILVEPSWEQLKAKFGA
jgi:mycoredoxin